MAILARRNGAASLYEQNRIDEARRELDELLPLIEPEHRTARAEALWQLALCHSARNEWGAAILAFRECIDLFDRVGESYNGAVIRHYLAEVFDTVGDRATAWDLRFAALRELGSSTTVRTQTCLSAISREAAESKRWRTAKSFLNLEIDMASHIDDPPSHTDALLRRAVANRFLGLAKAGNDDIETARAVIATMNDDAYRTRAQADLLGVESLFATGPVDAVRKLTVAIQFHEQQGRRMYLPALHLQRGRALRLAGDSVRAESDFRQGIDELENSRKTLDTAARLGIFDAAEELFEEATREALRRRDAVTAFQFVERARARVLLDSIPRQSGARLDRSVVLVEFFALSERLLAFVMHRDEIAAIDLGVTPSAVAEQSRCLAMALSKGDRAAAERLSAFLYQHLVEPLASRIDPSARLVFVPDQYTAVIPFAALHDEHGRFLIEDHAVGTAPSAAVFLRLEEAPAYAAPKGVLIVAAPTAGGQEPLEAAQSEARAIARLYPQAEVLTGGENVIAPFLRRAPAADAIHYAGHAISGEDDGSKAALLMTGEALDRQRIESLALRHTSVVVLAACSTGRGDVRWTEGPLSVARSFIAAGAPSVIATLWPINDREAAGFFPRLHQHLSRGVPPAEALRATQMEFLHRPDTTPIWASVELVGR